MSTPKCNCGLKFKSFPFGNIWWHEYKERNTNLPPPRSRLCYFPGETGPSLGDRIGDWQKQEQLATRGMFYWKKRPVRKKEFNTIKNRSLRSKRNLNSVLVTSTKRADILVLRIPFRGFLSFLGYPCSEIRFVFPINLTVKSTMAF